MDWVILIVVLAGTAASLYNAWRSYRAGHSAETSARLARHSANEAHTEREVASKAARIAVAATGEQDPGTAVDPQRVSGVPETNTEEPPSLPPSPWPLSRSVVSDTRPVTLYRNGLAIGVEVTADAMAALHGVGNEVPKVTRPDGTPWDFTIGGQVSQPDPPARGPALIVPDELAAIQAVTFAGWTDQQRQALYEHRPAAPDPTQSGAQSWPTGSAPEDPSRSGMATWPPVASHGTGGGDTSPGQSSGRHAVVSGSGETPAPGPSSESLTEPLPTQSEPSSPETGGSDA